MHLPTPTPDDRSPETRSTDMPAHPDPTHRDHGGTAPPAQAAGTPASRAGDSLTERYVWAVVRRLPRRHRTEEERELRSLIADTVEARTAAGEDPSTAERATLEELGDPTVLASRLSNRPTSLIGPDLYPDLVQLLRVVLVTMVPVVLLGMVVADTMAGRTGGAMIGHALWMTINTTIHVIFWTTAVFWVIDRTRRRSGPLTPWSLDDLPERMDLSGGDRRFSTREFLSAQGFQVIWVAAIVLLTTIPLVPDEGGTRVPLLAQDLWSPWLVALLAIALVESVTTTVVWRRGVWGWGAAGVNLAANVLVALILIHLLIAERLINPAALSGMEGVESWGGVAATAIAVTIAAAALWDSVEGIRRAMGPSQEDGAALVG